MRRPYGMCWPECPSPATLRFTASARGNQHAHPRLCKSGKSEFCRDRTCHRRKKRRYGSARLISRLSSSQSIPASDPAFIEIVAKCFKADVISCFWGTISVKIEFREALKPSYEIEGIGPVSAKASRVASYMSASPPLLSGRLVRTFRLCGPATSF